MDHRFVKETFKAYSFRKAPIRCLTSEIGCACKKFIISFIKGKLNYPDYLPYNVKLEKLSKDFLFSIRYKLIAFIKPVVYTQLYDLYRKNF